VERPGFFCCPMAGASRPGPRRPCQALILVGPRGNWHAQVWQETEKICGDTGLRTVSRLWRGGLRRPDFRSKSRRTYCSWNTRRVLGPPAQTNLLARTAQKMLVYDEADRIAIEMGSIRICARLNATCPNDRCIPAMFSATFPRFGYAHSARISSGREEFLSLSTDHNPRHRHGAYFLSGTGMDKRPQPGTTDRKLKNPAFGNHLLQHQGPGPLCFRWFLQRFGL